MVGRDHEDRVPEPGLLLGGAQELAHGVVGVLDGPAAALRGRRDVYLAVGIGEGPVVGGGHHHVEEGLAVPVVGVGLLQRLLQQVSVADAPDIGEGDLVLGEIGAVHDGEPVARVERVHVVEVTVAGVDVLVRVAQVPHDRAPGEEVPVVGALDDGGAGQRRYGEGHRLEAAHGARAGGVVAPEEQRLRDQRVEVRGNPALGAAELLEVFGAEALVHDDHHVEPLERPAALDLPQEIGLRALERRARL